MINNSPVIHLNPLVWTIVKNAFDNPVKIRRKRLHAECNVSTDNMSLQGWTANLRKDGHLNLATIFGAGSYQLEYDGNETTPRR
jgi:hypothetical protein